MEDQTLTGLKRVPGVVAAYVIDGQDVPGATLHDEPAQVQGSLLAALIGALGQATRDMDLGDLGEAIVETERGAIVAGAIPGGRTAVVVAGARANVGLIRVELRRLRRAS